MRIFNGAWFGILATLAALLGRAGPAQTTTQARSERAPVVALIGATVIDTDDYGTSTNDIADSVVLVVGQRIAAVGDRDSIVVPEDAHRIDATNKFVIPGLIDGFGVLNNQSYANAYLACGVTSIVGVGDANWRRGPMVYDCAPSPHVYRFDSIGYAGREGGKVFASPAEYVDEVTRMHKSGVRVLLLHYQLEPTAVAALAPHCRSLGIATIGEFGYTSYAEAIAAGVDSFVHTQRYSLDIAPLAMRRAIGNAPFDADNLRPYLELLDNLPHDDPRLLAHGRMLGTSRCGLITTLAMAYPDLPGARNPWTWPAAAILDAKDIHAPCDPTTGARPANFRAVTPKRAAQMLAFEKAYVRAGARYLAGSGTDAFGTMPGISLHQELELLVRAGLSPRQALAAATANYAAIYRWADVGRVRVGTRADLVVLDADPRLSVANLQSVHTVVRAGQPLDPKRLLAK